MPCRDYNEGFSYESPKTQEKLDKVTRLLCGLCRKIEKSKNIQVKALLYSTSADEELGEWWKEHQEQDRKRLKAEQEQERKKNLKKNALLKLTTEERKVLGI